MGGLCCGFGQFDPARNMNRDFCIAGNKVGIIAADDVFGQRLARHARKRLGQFGLEPEDFVTLTAEQLASEDQLKNAVNTAQPPTRTWSAAAAPNQIQHPRHCPLSMANKPPSTKG